MNQFANALGNSFNKDAIRIRSFELGGHTFNIKIPLTSDFDSMQDRIKIINPEKVIKYYAELSQPFLDNKEEFLKEIAEEISQYFKECKPR